MKTLPYKRTPCSNCPFKKDTIKGWLGEDRMTEILSDNSFVCHKTNNKTDKDRLQCAGHMLIKGQSNEFVSLASRLNIKLDLSGRDQVFTTEKDCIQHHKQG